MASLRNAPPLTAQDHTPDSGPVEVENQLVLRLPPEPAAALREALRSGASNVKDRLQIQMEPEKGTGNPQLRRGQVVFDGWHMSAKLMDLPTIIESAKTIDKKTFYKTADICQMIVCKEGEPSDDEEEEPQKKKGKNDPIKVDKKYVYKHGLCPPLKNCRRRRFRKTLRKKCVEAPEIEKEVKRLLRLDNEAVEIKYELVTEEELANKNSSAGGGTTVAGGANAAPGTSGTAASGGGGGGEDSEQVTMDHHDLFGALSDDSEDDTTKAEDEEASSSRQQRANIDVDSDDSNLFVAASGSQSANQPPASMSSASADPVVTQFNKDMFLPPTEGQPRNSQAAMPSSTSTTASANPGGGGGGAVGAKLESLLKDIEELKVRKQELQKNIANCDNQALLERFRQSLAEVEVELGQKADEADSLSMFS